MLIRHPCLQLALPDTFHSVRAEQPLLYDLRSGEDVQLTAAIEVRTAATWSPHATGSGESAFASVVREYVAAALRPYSELSLAPVFEDDGRILSCTFTVFHRDIWQLVQIRIATTSSPLPPIPELGNTEPIHPIIHLALHASPEDLADGQLSRVLPDAVFAPHVGAYAAVVNANARTIERESSSHHA